MRLIKSNPWRKFGRKGKEHVGSEEIMIEIKDLVLPKKGHLRMKYTDLMANIFEDGRFFCATSFDREWCCVGSIINPTKVTDNPDIKRYMNKDVISESDLRTILDNLVVD